MMQPLTHIIQKIIFRLTQRFRLATHALKSYYALGATSFGFFSRFLANAESCYLKNNDAERRGSYGLSDLDFVIIVKNFSDLKTRNLFLNQLGSLIAILKILFPFIEKSPIVLDREECLTPEANAFFLLDQRKPLRLYGREIAGTSDKTLGRLMALRKSVYCYFNLCELLFSAFSKKRLVDVSRLLEKTREGFSEKGLASAGAATTFKVDSGDFKQLLQDIRPFYNNFNTKKEISSITLSPAWSQKPIQDTSYQELKATLTKYTKTLAPLRSKGAVIQTVIMPLYHLRCYCFILVTPSFWEDPIYFKFLKESWTPFAGKPVLKFLKTGNPIPIESGHLKIFQYIEPLDGWWPNLQGINLENETAWPEDTPGNLTSEQDLLIRASLKFPYYWLNLFLSQKDSFTLLNFIAYRLPQGILYLKYRKLYCGRDEIEEGFREKHPHHIGIHKRICEEARGGKNRRVNQILADYGSFMEEMIRAIKIA